MASRQDIAAQIARELDLPVQDVLFAISAYDRDFFDLMAAPMVNTLYVEKLGSFEFRVPSYKKLKFHCDKVHTYIQLASDGQQGVRMQRCFRAQLNRFLYLTLLILDHVDSVCPAQKRKYPPPYLDALRADLLGVERALGVSFTEASIEVSNPAQARRVQKLRKKGLLTKFKLRQAPFDDHTLQSLRLRSGRQDRL